MTAGSYPEEIVHTAEEAAEIKERNTAVKAPAVWRANLWANVPAAIDFANQNPVSLPGSIIFNIRDNGQVWTYDFR
jgi:hypothetical protein